MSEMSVTEPLCQKCQSQDYYVRNVSHRTIMSEMSVTGSLYQKCQSRDHCVRNVSHRTIMAEMSVTGPFCQKLQSQNHYVRNGSHRTILSEISVTGPVRTVSPHCVTITRKIKCVLSNFSQYYAFFFRLFSEHIWYTLSVPM